MRRHTIANLCRLAGLALATIAANACATAQPASARAGGQVASNRMLSIAGTHFVDHMGRQVRLLGVDRAGTEFACVQGWGIFDGPSDAASVAAIASWHVDAVRLPLNEDCWLGINGVDPRYAGASYRLAVERYVALLHQYHLAVILDLHWAAPGTVQATSQLPMADADHAPALWTSVAATFRSDSDVVFDLFNEPFISTTNAATSDPWACWLRGCTVNPGGGVTAPWQSAGMQSLVDAVRAAGATQPVMVAGLSWANDLSGWLAHRPHDPAGQLAAAFHVYNFNACNTSACWDGSVGRIASSVPVVTGELGENDCNGSFVDQYMSWADARGVSYLGWTWNTWDCRSGPALITSYSGSPTAFGAALQQHLASIAARST